MKKLIALTLALLLAAPFAFAQSAEDRVVATVGDVSILQSKADALMPQLSSIRYNQDELDYHSVVETLVNQELLRMKISEMKFDEFTAEETAALDAEAQSEWDKQLDSYVQYYLSEDSDEARAKTRKEGEEFFAGRGLTLDTVKGYKKNSAAVDKMRAYLLGGYTPSEEEVLEVFNTVGEQYKSQFEGNVAMYETMMQYSGQKSWYTPEGYRGIIHILLKVDPAVLEQYTAMQAAFEEQHKKDEGKTEEKAEEQKAEEQKVEETVIEPVTEEQLAAARQAVLDSKKDAIADIYARLEKGESFEKLIEAYGEDPGMQNAEYLKDGYAVHAQSILYDPAFTAGAFSEKMVKAGDVSDPVVGTFGIHILKYHRDVPGGLVMTDDIHTEIEDYLTGRKENEVFASAVKTWQESIKVEYNEENIAAAAKEMQEKNAKEAAEEKTESAAPLEAVPAESGAPQEEAPKEGN